LRFFYPTYLFLLLLISNLAFGQNGYFPKVVNMRERAEVQDRWLENRVKNVLPDLMKRAEIDMWVIIAREYNEDPIIKTMLPATWQSARRTTILIAFDPGNDKPLETFGMSRYNTGDLFKTAWNKDKEPDQWKALAEMIQAKNPKRIGINKSETFALADGISSTHYDQLMDVLPKKFQERVVSAEKLAIGWLETRTPEEMMVYQNIVRIAHQIIAEGFSEQVIQPGVTTTDDVVWWFRDRIREKGFTAWFHPSVSIQRADPESFDHLRSFSERPEHQVILPGDLVHVDFGITYLGLNTDTQQHVYILKPGEKNAPNFLKEAFQSGNRVQDILTSQFETGRSGNEILKRALEQGKAEGLKPTIYTHPIGYHGHAAGPTIGLWDQQGGVPGGGDYPLYPNTAYSIELNNSVYIDDWKKDIRIMLEEDAYFDGDTVYYIDGRQTDLMTLPRRLEPNE
jgi:Xaa-Pro aminopeptidase